MSVSQANRTMVELTIDGRTVEAPEGSFVLAAARKLGIDVPTLCEHPDLEPAGACRLCMVDVTHAEWKGWHGLVTACLYPVQSGLEVSTRSPAVLEARRGVLSLLAARCPGSATIQALAARHGATGAGLRSDPTADDCILCGLCTRVCETYATAAITTASRGSSKRVSSFADAPPGECVGCGACAAVCPTGKIGAERQADAYHIWERSFPTAHCVVEPSRCIACGSCVEACPFAVARVGLRAGGAQVAAIDPEHCRGCGACVGACPTGAIAQHGYAWSRLLSPNADPEGLVVLACHRSNLPGPALSCAGRVSVPLLLATLARGAQGVLVLGRHEHTCRFDGAEGPARERVRTAQRLLELAGLDPRRLRMQEPAPGPQGPQAAAGAFGAELAELGALALEARPPDAMLEREGLDATLALGRWLWQQGGRVDGGPSWLRAQGLPAAADGQPALLVGELPWLDVAAEGLLAPTRLGLGVSSALRVLGALGVAGAGVAMPTASLPAATAAYALERAVAEASGATLLDELLAERGAELPRPPSPAKVAIDGSAAAARLVVALGYEPVSVGPDPLPERFAFSPQERARAEERLRCAERAGAAALLVSGPSALGRWALLVRHGAWQASRVMPVLGVHLGAMAIAGASLGRRALLGPPVRASLGAEVAS
jgi:bidirectional [NiFe] hydrogenase diaphorase subunit